MKESKRSKPQVYDRLSELPNSIIFHIFWFVPMNDVVKTTILSKRWRDPWTKTPFLNFDNHTPTLVNPTLLRWNGIRVLKFKVNSWSELHNSVHSDVDLWVNWSREKNVQELYLHLRLGLLFGSVDDVYRLPQCLYSCSSLKVLSLEGLSFKACNLAAMYVQWNQLTSLTITECFNVTEHAVTRILSGSPRLQVLDLSFVDEGANLNIRSDSLKELSICKYLYTYGRYDLDMVSELTICTPNLETLEIKGIPYTKYRLINVSSLTHATIGFRGLVLHLLQDDCDFPGMDLKNGFLSSQDYIGEKLSQVLQTIQHVETVSLFFCCLKVLRYMKMRYMHSSFPNVKSLRVRCCYGNYEQLVGLLQIFPQMESLVLHDDKLETCQDVPDAVEYETTIPNSFVLQLRIIEVTWSNGDSVFPVLETLLKYASKLEKMVFRVNGCSPPSSLLLASNKLMNMPRSSTNCKIKMIYSQI